MKHIVKLMLVIFLTITTSYASIMDGVFGGGDDSDSGCTPTEQTIEVRVSSSHDDAEERASNGSMYRNSSDLELTEDGHTQVVGIRFRNLNIPQGATITNAYIQFEVDETSSHYTHLRIKGEDVDNSSSFSDNDYDISSRDTTRFFNTVQWYPPRWDHRNDHGLDQRTPELKNIVQEIVDRGGWQSGNAMSFILTGSGNRVAESYDGESSAAPLLHIEYMGCPQEEDNSTNSGDSTATCYALTDDSDKLYKVSMLPNGNPLPFASVVNIATNFNGEGSAYRASDNKFYAFKADGDDSGPSDLYTIDIDNGTTTKVKDNIIAGAVDGAEFYFNPSLNKEILYLISGEYNSELYAFDPHNWSILSGYPKNTHTNLSSLAINPINGVAYAIDDYNYDEEEPRVYQLNLATGATTYLTQLQHLADAEGLAFASDGNLYIEDEGRDDLDGKRLYKVDLDTGALTPSAITNSNGDIEGLSCNGTQMAIEYPTIKIDNASSVVEGNTSITNLNFLITLSKPAIEDILLSYTITDETTTAGEDYIEENNLTILVPKDANSATITIKVKGDTSVEIDESLSLSLVDASNAVIDTNSVIGTIINDDEIIISIADANITEGDSGTKELHFSLTLNSEAPNGGVTVQVQPHNITANEGEDYTRNSSSVSFAEGENQKTIFYLINGDTDVEDNETFSVEIHNPQHAKLDENHNIATGTIINDDEEEETPELIAEYRFDECPIDLTDEIEDHSPHGHRHRVRNGFTTKGDIAQINRSGEFHRAEQQYTEGEDGLDEIFGESSHEFTISTWVHPTSLTNDKTNHNTSNTIFAKASDSKNDNIEIGINSNGTVHLYLDTKSKDKYADFGEAGDITTDSWHFIGVSYKDGEVTVVIDDKIYTNTTTWAGASNIDQAVGSPVTIGASLHIDNYFDGYMDEFKIFRNQTSTRTMNQFRERERNGRNWDDSEREEVVCTGAAPVGCIMSAFMFQNKPTDINVLNLANGEMVSIKSDISNDNINAVGFNKKDGYFWGYNYTKQNGTVTRIGMSSQGEWIAEDFLVGGLNGFVSYVGDIDNSGHLYLKESGNSRKVVVIDLDPNSADYLKKIRDFNLDFDLNTADWGFNARDNMLYAVNNGSANKYLYKIDPTNGHQISRENTLLTGNRGFGASFFDANGFYYIYDNGSGNIYRIDVANSSKAILFATGDAVSLNDGAMCTDAEFKFDFGDLPENYATTLENDGARHSLPTYGEPTVYMGAGVSHENDGKPSTEANLDESDDGVMLNGASLQNATLDAGATTTLTITTHDRGYLSAWIDWNSDGDFSDSNEQIASNIDGTSGLITLNVNVPSSAKDFNTYARFRYSYQQNLTATGIADDGEVEDYKISIDGNLEPFTCTQKLFLSNRTELGVGAGDSGATWLHDFNAINPVYTPIGEGFESSNGGYNAIGYNVADNFIYALYGNQLLKIDKNAVVENLGAVTDLPNTQLYAGEFDRDGFYYVTGDGGANNVMYKIDMAQKKVVKTITLSQNVRFWDMAIDTTGDYFYAMLIADGDEDSDFNNDRFAKINISTGEITTIGDSHSDKPSYISLIFSDADGKVIAISNENGMYEIDPSNGNLYWMMPTPNLSYYNDGTACPDSNFTLPPHIPRLSIGDVTKAEGDSGVTNFEFTLSIDADLPMMPMGMPVMFYYKVIDGNGNDVTPPHGVALGSDHDFEPKEGIGMNMNIFSNDRTQTITVPVYGDTKVESDEEFFVEIYFPAMFPSNFCMMGKDRGVGLILNDDMKFKVMRTNATDSDDDLLYTQIAGRDFDYAIVSYNSDNSENPVENLTLKVDLIDNNNNKVLYRGYKYIESGSRIDITNPSDLALSSASRDAVFRISLLKDDNGSMVHGSFTSKERYDAISNREGYSQTVREASDHFSIRPASYSMAIQDIDENNQSITYRTNRTNTQTPLGLVAEYNYRISAKATYFDDNGSGVKSYTSLDSNEINTTLIFKDKLVCNDTSNAHLHYQFNDGSLNQGILSHHNVGKYTLQIEDSNWTAVDQNFNPFLAGCIAHDAHVSEDGNHKSGCNIASNFDNTHHDIKLRFQPFEFDIDNINMVNIHGNGKEYLYMSDLRLSRDMGVQLHSNITAKGANGGDLSNFTKSCMKSGDALSFSLDFSFLSDRGEFNRTNYTPPKSITGSELSPQQIVEFNNENSDRVITRNSIDMTNKFLDENNGTLSVNILYNMEKLFREPTNPIKVGFIALDLNTTNLEATKAGVTHTPIGLGDINDSRTFYFARVVSSRKHYPETDKRVKKTPLFAEIFCKSRDNNTSWCEDTMNLSTVGEHIGRKTDRGWYLAHQHDATTEGGVLELRSDNPTAVSTNHTLNIPPFINGRIRGIETSYVPNTGITGDLKVEIGIDTDIWLRFNRRAVTGMPLGTSSYTVTFKGISSSTGLGEGGNNIESVKRVEHNGKMSW